MKIEDEARALEVAGGEPRNWESAVQSELNYKHRDLQGVVFDEDQSVFTAREARKSLIALMELAERVPCELGVTPPAGIQVGSEIEVGDRHNDHHLIRFAAVIAPREWREIWVERGFQGQLDGYWKNFLETEDEGALWGARIYEWFRRRLEYWERRGSTARARSRGDAPGSAALRRFRDIAVGGVGDGRALTARFGEAPR